MEILSLITFIAVVATVVYLTLRKESKAEITGIVITGVEGRAVLFKVGVSANAIYHGTLINLTDLVWITEAPNGSIENQVEKTLSEMKKDLEELISTEASLAKLKDWEIEDGEKLFKINVINGGKPCPDSSKLVQRISAYKDQTAVLTKKKQEIIEELNSWESTQ